MHCFRRSRRRMTNDEHSAHDGARTLTFHTKTLFQQNQLILSIKPEFIFTHWRLLIHLHWRGVRAISIILDLGVHGLLDAVVIISYFLMWVIAFSVTLFVCVHVCVTMCSECTKSSALSHVASSNTFSTPIS